MHDGMSHDSIQGIGDETLKVGNTSIFNNMRSPLSVSHRVNFLCCSLYNTLNAQSIKISKCY